MTLEKPARGMGRPSLTRPQRRDARIVIMMTEEERASLLAQAKRAECSLSTLCRQMILDATGREDTCRPHSELKTIWET